MSPGNLEHEIALTTWAAMFQQKQAFLQYATDKIHPSYLNGLKALGLTEQKIPTLSSLAAVLAPTGWRVTWIPGYVPSKVYSSLIAQGIFPLSQRIRDLKHLERSPIPDFLHDIWGHVPLLFDVHYSQFIRRISQEISKATETKEDENLYHAQVQLAELKSLFYTDHEECMVAAQLNLDQAKNAVNQAPSLYTKLGRLFAWTIEFGLFSDGNGQETIVGAGLLSSLRECLVITSGNFSRAPFSKKAVNFDFQFTQTQPFLYISSGLDQWHEVLSELLDSERGYS